MEKKPTKTPSEPMPPRPKCPRYGPDLEWPPYRYLPGIGKHPLRHPEGHLRGRSLPEPTILNPSNWGNHPSYLMGVDLFNAAYWWEAHEAWEGIWHLCSEDRPVSCYLKGLIQSAAALLQRHVGQLQGSERLRMRASENLLDAIQNSSTSLWLGLDVGEFVSQLNASFETNAQESSKDESAGIAPVLIRLAIESDDVSPESSPSRRT